MPTLRDKTILILSPQSWGKMFLSKHHYANELARRGNKVYFLNPPRQEQDGKGAFITIFPSGSEDNLLLIDHGLWFPYKMKFHVLPLFHWLMRSHVKKILKAIGQPVDIIWSFDLGNLYPFYQFGRAPYKLFHPVDEPLNQAAINSGKGASVIFSVTQEILDKYAAFDGLRQVVNHGLSEEFLEGVDPYRTPGIPLRTCLAGNLLRPDLDRDILLQIVRENPAVLFEFFGSYTNSQSNIGGQEDPSTVNFINALQTQKNVRLHGAVSTGALAKMMREMDLFLICYDVKRDQSRGTNYHKIMEYLSTGKVVVSNNVTAYKGQPELVQMVAEREHNRQLPVLFKQVLNDLAHFNDPSLQKKRISFAAANTYQKQLDRIERFITDKN